MAVLAVLAVLAVAPPVVDDPFFCPLMVLVVGVDIGCAVEGGIIADDWGGKSVDRV